jgi:hypothetical protein
LHPVKLFAIVLVGAVAFIVLLTPQAPVGAAVLLAVVTGYFQDDSNADSNRHNHGRTPSDDCGRLSEVRDADARRRTRCTDLVNEMSPRSAWVVTN